MLLRKPAGITHCGQKLWTHGNIELLKEQLHALLCSKACPGEKIIEAIDLAQRCPVEKECLRICLRGPQHIVICPARGIDPFRLPTEWRQEFKRNEILIVSPFDSSIRRPTKETAALRTRLVLSLAESQTVIHAQAGGLVNQILAANSISLR